MEKQKHKGEYLLGKRYPDLTAVGCFFQHGKNKGIDFFSEDIVIKNGDVFIYKDGVIWRV